MARKTQTVIVEWWKSCVEGWGGVDVDVDVNVNVNGKVDCAAEWMRPSGLRIDFISLVYGLHRSTEKKEQQARRTV